MTSCDEEAWDKKKSLWPILALLFQKSKVQKRLEQAQIVQDCCCCTACGARAWCHRHFLILPWRVATFLEGLFPGIRKACWKLRVTPKDAQGKTFHGVGHDSKVWYWSFERDMKALIFTAGLNFPAYGCFMVLFLSDYSHQPLQDPYGGQRQRHCPSRLSAYSTGCSEFSISCSARTKNLPHEQRP